MSSISVNQDRDLSILYQYGNRPPNVQVKRLARQFCTAKTDLTSSVGGCLQAVATLWTLPELGGSGRAARDEEVVRRLPGWTPPLPSEVPVIPASR